MNKICTETSARLFITTGEMFVLVEIRSEVENQVGRCTLTIIIALWEVGLDDKHF